MGRQDGLVLITGGVGNLSFYKTQDGYLVRKKSGVTRKRIMSEDAFERTRQNISEFGRGARATKLIRSAFSSLIMEAADNRVTSRLTSAVMKVIKSDAINAHGQRTVSEGDVALLQGFTFNKYANLTKTFGALFTSSIDRATGTMTVDIPAFDPAKLISAPDGATHFRLMAAGAAIDFTTDSFSAGASQSAPFPLSEEVQGPIQLSHNVASASTKPLFLVFAIEFLQCVNGKQCPLAETRLNAMSLVKVDVCRVAQLISEKQVAEEPVSCRSVVKPHSSLKLPFHEEQNKCLAKAGPFYDEQTLRKSLLIDFDVRQVDSRHELLTQLGLTALAFSAAGGRPAESNSGHADDDDSCLDNFPAIFKARDG